MITKTSDSSNQKKCSKVRRNSPLSLHIFIINESFYGLKKVIPRDGCRPKGPALSCEEGEEEERHKERKKRGDREKADREIKGGRRQGFLRQLAANARADSNVSSLKSG
jgi:hypothetical protein